MSNLNELRPINTLNPFARFCCTIGNLPSSYMSSLTYEEQLMWFCDYLKNTVIPAVNNNAEALLELQNFFANLDVQEEINNKLDEMVESGELQSIITQYLQIAGVLAYNTLNDLKNASNLIDGSFAMTFGKLSYNDGLGAFYKIRTLTSSDTVDGENIVAVNFSQTLIAEKQHNQFITDLNNKIDKKENNLKNKKFIFIGDSYNAGQSHDGAVSKWGDDLAQKLGLSTFYNLYSPGAGFHVGGSGGKTFKDILELNLQNITNKNEIDYILVGGGYNDANYGAYYSDIISDIETFCNFAKNNFPNAKVLIACFGYDDGLNNRGVTVRTQLYQYVLPAYKHNFTIDNQPVFIKNSEYILHNDAYFSSDYIHPNQAGINKIVSCLYEYLTTGNINISSPIYTNSPITIDGNSINFTEQLINENNIRVTFHNTEFNFSEEKTFTASNHPFKIGTHNSRLIRGFMNAFACLKNVDLLLQIHNVSDYTYYNKIITVDLIFNGVGDFMILWKQLNSQGTWDSISNITKFTILNIASGFITPYLN